MAEAAGNWCLIESDPGVFTDLIQGFGVEGVECEEVYDLKDLDRVADAFGFIFLYKWQQETEVAGNVVSDARADSIFFAKQVITNACATQAIVNILMNIPSDKLDLGSTLGELKAFSSAFDSQMKGLALSNSEQIRKVHNSFSSYTLFELDERPASKDDDVYHFIGYLPIDGMLYELDGLRNGPIEHNPIPAGASWVDVVRPVLEARMNSYMGTQFNLMAVVPHRLRMYQRQLSELYASGQADPDLTAELQRQIDSEQQKAQRYRTENIRRRHNYLPFIVELLKMLAEDGQLTSMVERARSLAGDRKRQKLQTGTGTS